MDSFAEKFRKELALQNMRISLIAPGAMLSIVRPFDAIERACKVAQPQMPDALTKATCPQLS